MVKFIQLKQMGCKEIIKIYERNSHYLHGNSNLFCGFKINRGVNGLQVKIKVFELNNNN